MRKAVSSDTQVDKQIFVVSRSNMDRFVNDIVPGSDIVLPHLEPCSLIG